MISKGAPFPPSQKKENRKKEIFLDFRHAIHWSKRSKRRTNRHEKLPNEFLK